MQLLEQPADVARRILELFCAWGGIVFSVLFGIGFVGIGDQQAIPGGRPDRGGPHARSARAR